MKLTTGSELIKVSDLSPSEFAEEITTGCVLFAVKWENEFHAINLTTGEIIYDYKSVNVMVRRLKDGETLTIKKS